MRPAMRPAARTLTAPVTAASSPWMWLAVVAIGALYVCSTLPTPLYPLYRREFGFSELVVTAIYASYVVGNMAVLFVLGRVSDQIGRRPASLLAFGILALSAVCFLLATATAWLYIARILNGIAAGLGASALTAWIAELEPHHDRARAATVATAGNLAGLAFGPAFAGLMAQHAPWPLHLSYAVYLLLLIILFVCIRSAPECVGRGARQAREVSLRPRLGIPKDIRTAFVAPAAIAFATFALGGFYAALTPGLLSHLQQHDLSVLGGIVALFFGLAALVAAITGRMRERTALVCSTALLLVGLGVLLYAERLRSMPLLILATALSGMAVALGFRSSLQIVNRIAPAAQRAEVISSYLLVCYTANSLPVIGVGLLSLAVPSPTAHLAFAALLAVLALLACGTGVRYLPRAN